jgi:DNA-binding transcriptional LysR family regulator
MADRTVFDNIDLYLVRVLHTVITERSVSKAALRLASNQPAVSAQLKRLRELTGDPILVRSGHDMAPTDVALQLVEPAAAILREAEALFGARRRSFEPATSTMTFRIAASDNLDPLFLPELVGRLKAEAPGVRLDILPLTADFDYRKSLARGGVDLVVGNWLEQPGELHLGRLISDEIVCLVAEDHFAVRNPRGWTAERYLAAQHIAPMSMHPGWHSVIDEHLARLGHTREIAVRSPHFGLTPLMVARSQLVLTTGRLFCTRYTEQFGLRIVKCPIDFPPLHYYQLWHELTHSAAPCRWLREHVRDTARSLSGRRLPATPRTS